MLKDPILKQIIVIATIVSIVIALIFAVAAYWYYSLLTGWILGVSVSIGTFFLKGWVMKSFFSKHTTSRKAAMASILHTFGYFLIFGVCLISLLAINFAAIGKNIFVDSASKSVVNSPINLFTFIAGIHVVMIAIFISHHLRNKKLKKEGINNKEKVNANI